MYKSFYVHCTVFENCKYCYVLNYVKNLKTLTGVYEFMNLFFMKVDTMYKKCKLILNDEIIGICF